MEVGVDYGPPMVLVVHIHALARSETGFGPCVISQPAVPRPFSVAVNAAAAMSCLIRPRADVEMSSNPERLRGTN